MLLAPFVCQLKKQLAAITIWIFFWDLLNNEAWHVAGQNTVSLQNVREGEKERGKERRDGKEEKGGQYVTVGKQ